MRIKISQTGQVTFFPERELDVFTLGKLAARYKKGGSFVRWEYSDKTDPMGIPAKQQARDLSKPGIYTYTLQSLTLPVKVLLKCVKAHILKEVS